MTEERESPVPVGVPDGFTSEAFPAGRIRAVLRRLAIGPGEGRLATSPDTLDVVRMYNEGRGGALVLGVVAHRGRATTQYVAKLGSPAEALREWDAFRGMAEERRALFVPIEAVTTGVLDPATAIEEEGEAVLYTDLGSFVGKPGLPPESLGDVIAAAMAGPRARRRAVHLLDDFLDRVGEALYAKHQVADGPGLREVRRWRLGPELRLLVDGLDAEGRWTYGPPGSEARYVYPDDVLDAAFHVPGLDDPAGPEPGCLVRLRGFRPVDGDRQVVTRDGVTVGIVPAGGHVPAPIDVSDLRGSVLDGRSARRWEQLRAALPGLRLEDDGAISVDGCRAAHPFAALRRVLSEPVEAAATASIHGDLNPGNVLFAREQAYLIDYARGGSSRPILTDLAWLELNLLRAPLAEALSFPDLVAIQRLLLLGDRVADLLPADRHAEVTARLAEHVADRGEAAVAAVLVLGTIRRHAQRIYPGRAKPVWWHEYLATLLLSAHRAMKWADDTHTDAVWRAQLAIAAVATETLSAPGDGLTWWRPEELTAAVARLAPLLDGVPAVPSSPGEPERSAAFLAAVVRGAVVRGAVDRGAAVRGAATDDVPVDALRPFRARIAAAAVRRAGLRAPEDDGYPAIPLSAEVDSAIVPALSAVLDRTHTVLVGTVGSGRSTLLRMVERTLLAGHSTGRIPVRLAVPGPDAIAGWFEPAVRTALAGASVEPVEALLGAGAVHVLVDEPGRLPVEARRAVLAEAESFRARYPAVAICLTGGDPRPDGQPSGWSTVRLLPVTLVDAVDHLRSRGRHPAAAVVGDGRWSHFVADGRCGPLLVATIAQVPESSFDGPAVRADVRLLEKYYGALADEWDDPEIVAYAEALAAHRTDPDVVPAPPEPSGADRLGPLLDAGLLVRSGARLDFAGRTERDYFAARWLGAAPDPARFVLRPRWDDVFRALAARPASPVGAGLIHVVESVDPVQAAAMLGALPRDPDRLAERVLARLETVLRDPDGVPAEQAEAAAALAAVEAPLGWAALRRAFADPNATPSARTRALDALRQAALAADDAPANRDRIAQVMTRHVPPLLSADHPPELVRSALTTVADLRLRRLGGLVTDLIDPANPAVALAAVRAARALALPSPPTLERAIRATEAAALADLERSLPAQPDGPEVNRLQTERMQLVERLPPSERRVALRARQSAFEIGELCRHLLAELGDPVDADADPEPLSQQAERVVTAADRVATGQSTDLEHLASLATALSGRDRAVGLRTAWAAHRRLAAGRVAERFRWPWATALARCTAGQDGVLALAETDPDLALEILGNQRFPQLAAPGPQWAADDVVRLRAQVVDRLTGRRPVEPWLPTAAATLGAVDAVPLLRDAVVSRRWEGTVSPVGLAGQDPLEVSLLADAAAALGYLGRSAPAEPRDVLLALDPAGAHPSVAIGRAAGLAYLGAWQPVLESIGDDPRLSAIGGNLAAHWIPRTEAVAAARYLADRFAGGNDPAEVRSALLRLRRRFEHRAGTRVRPAPGAGGHRSIGRSG
ncbi:hypothetical protein [Cryptosporangium aurantiacum]|uniref:Ternary complex associated domain-containing protein n=1 Tax=Cryptosporangium aurantiacum TaxID=134849 RepID=A0A1M7R1T6_9ACTN|nr:hypothetical protein [Cryptosporangium aurantiacum]SHN38529.1 hypothetical protein SAMN05443668_10692 [Cryptosporangium aurantiacum]